MSDDLIRKFNAWDKAISASAQTDWREEARDCFAMAAGDQVKEEDKRAAEEKGILYAILNKIDPTVSAICGSEITNRQEVRYYPRQATRESAQANEVLTAAAEWARDECDAGDEESEAFRSCIICGMGWTETRMSYDVDPDGMPVTEQVDALEMGWDASSRRPNLADSRYRRRKKRFGKEEAAERFGIDPDAYGTSKDAEGSTSPHNADPEDAYQGRGEAPLRKDEIEITEYQWYELEPRMRVANPQTGELEELSQDEYAKIAPLLEQAGAPEGVPFKGRCYYRAFRIADEIISGPEKLPEGDFTLNCITGKLDRNKGVWYGVVRAMRDAQRLLNKQVTQLQRIIDVNAKGGLLAEAGAFEDDEQAKAEWAASDTIVFTKSGMLGQNPKVVPKPVGQYPSAIDKMLALTLELVPGISGVNNEMLGVIDREQAGVVEWQRKEAAYGVLKVFFNSMRRYRRQQGRLLLKLITKYMSDGRLVRIQGRMGDIRYVQLAKQADTQKYDVIVDEAPAGPNQKERTFMFLTQFGPMLAKLGLPPQIWLKMMEYSPLPASLVAEVQQIMQNMPQQQDPKAVAMQQKLQFDMAAKQMEMQMGQQEAAASFQLEQAKTQAQLQGDAAAQRQQAELDARKAAMDAEIERYKAQGMLQIKQAEMDAKAALAEAQFEFEARMQAREMQFEERMRAREVDAKVAAARSNGSDTRFGGDVG